MNRALPAVQPKVKPLVWDNKPLGGFHIAKLPFGGEIRIMWDLSLVHGERYVLHPFSLGRIAFRTLDTAKAAAQADYEARILSALEPAVQPDADSFADLIADARLEAAKAMNKFPQPNYVISKVAEEAGEVVKAAIHCAEGRETAESVRGEIKQVIAMLYRLWVEGDQVHGLAPLDPALINNPGKEVMPSEARSNRAAHDTAPAGLSAGGGAAWQPIETAPRDGTWFVICLPGERFEVGRFYPAKSTYYVPSEIDGLFRQQEKVIHEWGEFNNFHRATHWLPLPAPPVTEGGA